MNTHLVSFDYLRMQLTKKIFEGYYRVLKYIYLGGFFLERDILLHRNHNIQQRHFR
jgi:hypothetical protein